MPSSTRVSGISKPGVQAGAGGLIVGVAIVFALLGTRVAPYDPLQYDVQSTLESPGARHWLGTDSLGRDVLSQIIAGTRLSLAVGTLSVLTGMAVGTVIG